MKVVSSIRGSISDRESIAITIWEWNHYVTSLNFIKYVQLKESEAIFENLRNMCKN